MKIEGIYHIGITVNNLEKSVYFYHKILGLEIIAPPGKPCAEIDDGKPVGVKGAVIRTCLLKAADDSYLEFLEYYPKSSIKNPVPMNTTGAHHISLLLDDINKSIDQLKKYNIEFLYKPLVINSGYYKDVKWVYFKDPDGIILELMEKPKTKKE